MHVLNKKIITKIIDNIKIIVGAGELSIKKLKYNPKKTEINVEKTDINCITKKFLLIKKAIEPGRIIKPIERIKPTVYKFETTIKEITIKNK